MAVSVHCRPGWTACYCSASAGPTHELGGNRGPHHGREVGCDEGHAALHVLEHVQLGLVEGLHHVTRLKHQVHLLLFHFLPEGGREEWAGSREATTSSACHLAQGQGLTLA